MVFRGAKYLVIEGGVFFGEDEGVFGALFGTAPCTTVFKFRALYIAIGRLHVAGIIQYLLDR